MMSRMSDLPRSRSGKQIWITRGHLAALAVATFFIALLAFLVGLQVGRTQAVSSPEVVAAAPALPEGSQEDALEALLREVEYAQGAVSPDGALASAEPDLTFPAALGAQAQPEPPADALDEQAVSAEVEPPLDEVPQPPPSVGDKVPADGWSVQVASYPTVEEAESSVEAFRTEGMAAYRVGALVDGHTWYRVRIGGFDSRKKAEDARRRLVDQLGDPGLMVAAAP